MSAISSESVSRESKNSAPFVQRLTSDAGLFWKAAWAILLACCIPFLIPYFRSLWRQELYQYFPFVIIGVGYLAFIRWDRTFRGPRSRIAWSLLTTGVLLLLIAGFMHSTWLGALAFVTIGWCFLSSQRSLTGGSLGYLALPLIMLIRIPQLHAQSIVVRLQNTTSQLSSLVLDVLGVAQDSSGNTIRLPSKELFVAEACSGIQSAFTMCFLALLVVVWQKRPLIATPLYVVVALVLAIVANIFRVVVIVLAEAWYSYDLTEGFAHDLVGYLSLTVAAAMLLSFDKFCSLLLHPVDVPVGKQGPNPFGVAWNYLLGFKTQSYADTGYTWETASPKILETVNTEDENRSNSRFPVFAPLSIVSIACVAALTITIGFLSGRSDSRPITAKDEVLFNPPKDFLDGRIGVLAFGNHEVVRNGSDPQLGLHADIWKCGTESVGGQIVMSQPYVGWHELCVCYEVQDWKLEERYNLDVQSGKPIAIGRFTKGEGQFGYLFFTAIDSDGNVPTPPSYTLFGRVLAPFGPLITDDYAETSGSAQTIMLQFWTTTTSELPSSEINEIANSIAEIRQQASASVTKVQTSTVTAPQ